MENAQLIGNCVVQRLHVFRNGDEAVALLHDIEIVAILQPCRIEFYRLPAFILLFNGCRWLSVGLTPGLSQRCHEQTFALNAIFIADVSRYKAINRCIEAR